MHIDQSQPLRKLSKNYREKSWWRDVSNLYHYVIYCRSNSVTAKTLEHDCAVCKEQFILGTEDPDEQIVITLPCNHPFHMPCILPWLKSSGTCPVCRYVLVHLVQCFYFSHHSAVTLLSLSLIITLHGQVLDQILIVVVVHAGLTLALMRVGAAGLNLEVYFIRFLVG